MATSKLQAQLETAHHELGELRADLPKLEVLLSQHETTEREATRAARHDPAELDRLTEAQWRREAVGSMLEQHRGDIETAEQRVLELQTQLQTETDRRRLKTLTRDLTQAEATFRAEAVEAHNAFLRSLIAVKELRETAQSKHEEAARLARALGEAPPLLNNAPQHWALRAAIGAPLGQLSNILVGAADNIMKGRTPQDLPIPDPKKE